MKSYKVKVTVWTSDPSVLEELTDNRYRPNQSTYAIPELGTLELLPTLQRRGFGAPEILEFILTFSSGVVSGVIANWLFGRIKKRASSLKIDYTEVAIDENEIQKVVQLRIEKE